MTIGSNQALIKLGIIENDPSYRRALYSLFSLSSEFEVAGIWKDAGIAVQEITDEPPHILLIEIQSPDADVIACMRQLKKKHPSIQFLVHTCYEEDDSPVLEAFKAGATGYLLKKDGPEALIRSVRELHAGGVPLSRDIAHTLINFFNRTSVTDSMCELLTRREEEVLVLLSEGKMYKEVAIRLGITMETVKKHTKHIYHKLEVQNRMEAVNKWRKGGIV
ncbi:MAG: response regulator transcription factor [Chitinophagaceae bacterium]|nr:response regulator transcription factor [Chitinophagaceae bacterium]